jgi:hypothetical protein
VRLRDGGTVMAADQAPRDVRCADVKWVTPRTYPALQVHDNPDTFLACNYDPAKALCHPSRDAGKPSGHPALERCNHACANIARTDEHINALTAETARLRAEAASPLAPSPIRQRLAQRAATLDEIAERHARTRIIPGADDGRR